MEAKLASDQLGHGRDHAMPGARVKNFLHRLVAKYSRFNKTFRVRKANRFTSRSIYLQ
jgi:hypothetical protein